MLNYGGFDQVSLATLPSDGAMSLDGIPNNDVPTETALNAQATPKNFAGQQVTIPEPTTALLVFLGMLGATVALRRRHWERRKEVLDLTTL